MKKTMIMIFILLAGLSSSVLSADESTPLICRVTNWTPHYYEVDGVWKGSSVDAYQALADEAGLKIRFKVLPWSRAIREMKYKPILLANLTKTEEREEYIHFIGPHYLEIQGVAINNNYKDEKIRTWDDLWLLTQKTGKRIIYQQDAWYSEEFHRKMAEDPEFSKGFYKMAVNVTETVRMVAKGMFLGVMEDVPALKYLINAENLQDQVVVNDFKVSENRVYIGISKTVPEAIVRRLREADQRLKNRKVYEAIQKRTYR